MFDFVWFWYKTAESFLVSYDLGRELHSIFIVRYFLKFSMVLIMPALSKDKCEGISMSSKEYMK